MCGCVCESAKRKLIQYCSVYGERTFDRSAVGAPVRFPEYRIVDIVVATGVVVPVTVAFVKSIARTL